MIALSLVAAMSPRLPTATSQSFALRPRAPVRMAVLDTEATDALAEQPPASPLMQSVVDAVQRACENPDREGQESYGDWLRDADRNSVLDALRGIRGRKCVWWLDAPRPLRVVVRPKGPEPLRLNGCLRLHRDLRLQP